MTKEQFGTPEPGSLAYKQAHAVVDIAGKLLKRNGYTTDLTDNNWGVSREALKSDRPITVKDVIIFDPVN
jgi:hypothetical protein